jgi:hypothetical protein
VRVVIFLGASVEITLELPNNWRELVESRTEFYRNHTQKQLQRVVVDLMGKVGNLSIASSERGSAFLDLHVALLLLTNYWK